MFYLPRLYVYHCSLVRGSAESERFKVMERRLLKQIMVPAMLATWFFGALLVLTPGIVEWAHFNWWHVKLVMVLLMTGFQGCGRQVAAPVPRRPEPEARALLPPGQRGADGADGDHRHHGDRQAVLNLLDAVRHSRCDLTAAMRVVIASFVGPSNRWRHL